MENYYNTTMKKNKLPNKEYEYGFKDKDVSILNTGKGLNEDVIRMISHLKKEPEWMLNIRLRSYRALLKLSMTKYGPDLSILDFDAYT